MQGRAAEVQQQLSQGLQQLLGLCLQQGDAAAVQRIEQLLNCRWNVVAPLVTSVVKQHLLPHTATLLAAVAQPGKPPAVQRAAWTLLSAWAGLEDGAMAIMQHDWQFMLPLMSDIQEACVVVTSTAADLSAEAAAAVVHDANDDGDAAAASDAADQLWQQTPCSSYHPSLQAAILLRHIARTPAAAAVLAADSCVDLLMQAAMCWQLLGSRANSSSRANASAGSFLGSSNSSYQEASSAVAAAAAALMLTGCHLPPQTRWSWWTPLPAMP
jgi:hypothetical protein